jgi:hypothetical protein
MVNFDGSGDEHSSCMPEDSSYVTMFSYIIVRTIH